MAHVDAHAPTPRHRAEWHRRLGPRRLRVELLGDLPHPSVVQQAGVPEPARAVALSGELEAVIDAAMAQAA